MFRSASTFVYLPPELWERILLLLTPWEVLKLRTLSCGFRDLIDGSPMVQYRIQMFEVAVEEGSGPDKSPLNLADLRLQLGRYRSRWDSFDQATRETITIPPTKIRICEKGYLAYVLQGDSGATFCARVIRLPSVCNGVTRGEWTFNLEMLSPDAMVLGMTLQPELDLLVVIVSSCGHTVSRVHTLQLSNGRPHSTIPTPEPIRSEAGFRFLTLQPCITRYRLAFLVIYLQPGSQNACTFRVYELQTGQVILDEPQQVLQIKFIDDFWLLAQNGDSADGFTLWDITNPTAQKAWTLQDPAPPYPGVLDREYFEIASSPGGTGVFRTDSSRRVLAISGRVTTEEGTRRRRRFVTFVIHSSALTSLALGEKRGATIEWEKWKGKVTTVDRSSRLPYVEVEGSQVFILGKRVSQETGTDFTCTVHDFSPGARKEQGNPPYISQQLTLTTTRLSTWWPQRSWEVSGNTVVLLDGHPGLPATEEPSTVIFWSI